ncbi:hypothetical protein [Corallococcus macrosporus]|uniref:Uncharacterized protein n=1 Tax=Corallococcus macrosporus DSM 14697 TaxID=1189310 RepID=A0A250K046_9BACT|nr:hypothetical protein [Corallococcus macrosporus]ATB49474.1 hypothetical protein MYMAC_005119 [Corallococcus macrosporus DSM 14697]
MPRSNSFNDVFRFIQLRPPTPAKAKKPLSLLKTSLAARLEGVRGVGTRMAAAEAMLQSGTETVRGVADLPGAAAVIAVIEELREQADATTDELLERLGKTETLQVAASLTRLSDTLLASYHYCVRGPRGGRGGRAGDERCGAGWRGGRWDSAATRWQSPAPSRVVR